MMKHFIQASIFVLCTVFCLTANAKRLNVGTEDINKNLQYTLAFGESVAPATLAPVVITVAQGAENGGITSAPNAAYVSVESISVPTEISIPVGYSYQIKVVVSPSDATNKSLEWMSFDEDIATVSSTGVVTGKKPGEVGIFVRAQENEWVNAMITLNVTPAGTEPIVPDPGSDGKDPIVDPDPTTPTDAATYTIRLDYSKAELYLTTFEVADNTNYTYSLSSEPEEFYVVSTEKGYTLQSASTKKYVGYSGATTWDCYDVADVWTIGSIEGVSTTIFKNSSQGLGVDYAENGKGVFTDKPDWRWIITPCTPVDPETPENPQLEPCATPVIALADGVLTLSCPTPGAVVSYTLMLSDTSFQGNGIPDLASVLSSLRYVVTATATADGYLASAPATASFSFQQMMTLLTASGDMNADGDYTIADITELIKKLIDSNAK